MRICMAPSSPPAKRTDHLLRIPDILCANDNRPPGSYLLVNICDGSFAAANPNLAEMVQLPVSGGRIAIVLPACVSVVLGGRIRCIGQYACTHRIRAPDLSVSPLQKIPPRASTIVKVEEAPSSHPDRVSTPPPLPLNLENIDLT